MFCPPEVRAKYAKKFGKKRVEKYERDMMERQKNGMSELGKAKDGSKPFIRFLKSNKRSKRAKFPEQEELKNSGSLHWVPANGEALELGSSESSNNHLKKYQLGENNNNNNDDDDDLYLDAEFAAYADGSTSSSEEEELANEDYYEESSDSKSCSSESGSGRNKRNREKSKAKNDLWSLPNGEALREFEQAMQARRSRRSLKKGNRATGNLPTASNSSVSPTGSNKSTVNHNSVVGIFVNAFQGLNLFSGDFFGNNDSNTSESKNAKSSNVNKTNKTAETYSSPSDSRTRQSFHAQTEQQKRANELVAALGMFGEPDKSTSQYSLQQKAIMTDVGSGDSSNQSISDVSDEKGPGSKHKRGIYGSTTKRQTNGSGATVKVKRVGESPLYCGGTYDDCTDDDDNGEEEKLTGVAVLESSSHRSKSNHSPKYAAQYCTPTSASTTSDMIVKRQLKTSQPADISIIAQTSHIAQSLLNEPSPLSPAQKRQLSNHYTQLRNGRQSQRNEAFNKQVVVSQDEDEIMDIDEDGEDDDLDDSDDSVDDSEMRREEKRSSASGVNHVGAGVFISSEKKSRYPNSSNRPLRNSVTSRNSRSSSVSVGSLSNIDEDSVVESCSDDLIPAVNRLMLRDPGTLWQDNKGRVSSGMRSNVEIPDFKPRLEEDKDEDDSEDEEDTGSQASNTIGNTVKVTQTRSSQFQSMSSPKVNPSPRLQQRSPAAYTRPFGFSSSNIGDSPTVSSAQSGDSSIVSDNGHGGGTTTFCFGGIQLVSPSLFHSTESSQQNSNSASEANVSKSNYKSSSASSFDKGERSSQSSSRVSSSSIYAAEAELFGSAISNEKNNLKDYLSRGTSSPFQNSIAQHSCDIRSGVKRDYGQRKTSPYVSSKLLRTSSEHNANRFDKFREEEDTNDEASVSSAPTKKSSPLFRSDGLITSDLISYGPGSGGRNNRSRLSSSFRSSAMSNHPRGAKRASYNLGSGKRAMSKEERARVQSFLPNRPVIAYDGTSGLFSLKQSGNQAATSFSSPTSQSSPQRVSFVDDKDSPCRSNKFTRTIAVLLVEPVQKVFEVVFLDSLNIREATVGDTLAQARANAIDPALSEQKYNSLCNETQELAAPMLPVEFLLNAINTSKTRKGASHLNNLVSVSPLTSNSPSKDEKYVLLVAVPVGYSAKDMQAIKALLWKNPKTTRWWEQMQDSNGRSNTGHHSISTVTPERKSPSECFSKNESCIILREVDAGGKQKSLELEVDGYVTKRKIV